MSTEFLPQYVGCVATLKSSVQDIGPRYAGVLLGMSNTAGFLLKLQCMLACTCLGVPRFQLQHMPVRNPSVGGHRCPMCCLPSASGLPTHSMCLITAGVLAGVFGTAATGYILKHGTWDEVWGVAVALYLVGALVWNAFSTGASPGPARRPVVLLIRDEWHWCCHCDPLRDWPCKLCRWSAASVWPSLVNGCFVRLIICHIAPMLIAGEQIFD